MGIDLLRTSSSLYCVALKTYRVRGIHDKVVKNEVRCLAAST